jgi:hypothetical protein
VYNSAGTFNATNTTIRLNTAPAIGDGGGLWDGGGSNTLINSAVMQNTKDNCAPTVIPGCHP